MGGGQRKRKKERVGADERVRKRKSKFLLDYAY